ncbi:MAG: hypothetical protein JWO82_123 [Akkermansiaceae bacterium]|nr:hypothetical protein [Akkermansiaceae bacterium]
MKLYQDSYTPEELQAILAFYATPAGLKTLTTMPIISQKATQMGQKYAAKNQEAFQGELRAIFQRYQKPAAGAPPAEAKQDLTPAAPAPPAPEKK